MLNVHVNETGNVTGADIVSSSGFADLDEAARNCITNGWHFIPATQNGKPIADTKQYKIVWKLIDTSMAPQLQTMMEADCANIFSDASNRWAGYKSATLQFRITTKGTVSHPFVASTSGDSLFDAKAVQCAARLKYTPPIIDDVPTEVSWNAAVRWSPHTGLAYTDGYDLELFCADSYAPANLWKGDPPNGTVISFHVIQDGSTDEQAIERSSGNPALDQGAMECVRGWKAPFAASANSIPSFGDVVLVNWKDGHAFVLTGAWK
jgi:TonB family protein